MRLTTLVTVCPLCDRDLQVVVDAHPKQVEGERVIVTVEVAELRGCKHVAP